MEPGVLKFISRHAPRSGIMNKQNFLRKREGLVLSRRRASKIWSGWLKGRSRFKTKQCLILLSGSTIHNSASKNKNWPGVVGLMQPKQYSNTITRPLKIGMKTYWSHAPIAIEPSSPRAFQDTWMPAQQTSHLRSRWSEVKRSRS